MLANASNKVNRKVVESDPRPQRRGNYKKFKR